MHKQRRFRFHSRLCLYLFLGWFFFFLSVVALQIPLDSKLNVGDNNNWVSSNGNFAFGFYNRSDQPNQYSVGIQFNSNLIPVSEQTVVWVVGADVIVGCDSFLHLTQAGDLVLFDPSKGSPMWTSNTSHFSVAWASLLDNGKILFSWKSENSSPSISGAIFTEVASLGIKELLPASLDPNLKPEDLLTGVNFGSGASGYDPLTAKTASVLSLPDQIKLFKDYIKNLKGIAGEERAAAIISDSIYISDVGIDDIINNYFALPIRRKQFNISSYTDFIVNLASEFYQELYSLGARKIGIVGLPPGGCFPSQRTIAGGITRECVELYNQAIRMFNSKLSKKVEMLGASLSNSKIIFIEVYNVFDDIIRRPSNYGFEVIDRGCCGTGKIEVAELCNPSTPVCEDVTKYVFWDSFHPTEKTYKILADYIIKNYLPKLL